MSDVELKPCPFCGGEAYLKSALSDIVVAYVIPTNEYKVICKNCRCSSGVWMQKSKAVETWNRRVIEWQSKKLKIRKI